MKNLKWDGRYLQAGITALLVIFCCIVFYVALQRWTAIRAAVGSVASILTPFVWGAVLAYLLRPLLAAFQGRFFAPLAQRLTKNRRTGFAIARGLSVLMSEIVAVLIVAVLLWLIIPRFYESIQSIILALPDYYMSINRFATDFLDSYPELESLVRLWSGQIYIKLNAWLENDFQPQVADLVGVVSTSLAAILGALLNVFIAVIASCYLLYNKEKFGGKAKRILYGVFSVKHAEGILSGLNFVDHVFMGFLFGKLIDSAIIGVLCFIGCSILQMPYAVLISVIVGVTNIIPYFGPFIGAIPSAFIILMVSPFKCLIFVVFIFALQQFDGNILGPKILGSSVGISGFWVMFSIIVANGLMGFTGMLVGVLLSFVLSTGVTKLIDALLKKRGLQTETACYTCIDHIDPDTHEPVRKTVGDVPDEIIEGR